MKKTGATSTTLAGVLIVGLLIGAGAVYVAAPSLGISGATTVTQPGGGTVTKTITVTGGAAGICNGASFKIGHLDDFSGSLATTGIAINNSLKLAIQDINAYFTQTGCHITFSLSTYDYHSDPATALLGIQALSQGGVTAIIGPIDSDSVANVLSYANSHQIVMVSPSSTAADLAINNDYLFRVPPTDLYQGKADADIMWNQSVRDVIVVNREGHYGSGLANSTIAFFKAAGGNVEAQIQYPKDTTSWGPIADAMLAAWNSATTTSHFTADQVAIYTVTEAEALPLFTLLNSTSTYRALLNTPQPWYGTDANAQDTSFTDTSSGSVGGVYKYTRTLNTIYSAGGSNPKFNDFLSRFTAAYGNTFQSYGAAGYDGAWLIALSVAAGNSGSGSSIHDLITTTAANYYGVSGWTVMGPSGDGLPFLGYSIWQVVTTNTPTANAIGTPPVVWELAGHWDTASGTITWSTGFPINP